MMPSKTPYRELIDFENRDLTSGLTGASWAAWQEAYSDAVFFDLPAVQAELERTLRMTGSIDGRHRTDIKEAIQGIRAPTMPLGVAMGLPAPESNGMDKKALKEQRRQERGRI